MGELVALEAQSMKSELPKYPEEDTLEAQSMKIDLPENPEEDDVDFALCLHLYTWCLPHHSRIMCEKECGKKPESSEETLKLSETESVASVVDDVSMNKAHLSLISKRASVCEDYELGGSVEHSKKEIMHLT
ncbi:hypothetical protein Leryth_008479 [Lithospermum erythrorhizon]|nr:hypothetical protein Leryth_008479 [Lithospermum erythrorhizon]